HLIPPSLGAPLFPYTTLFRSYIAIGSSCNICVEKTPDRAAVMRYDADGKNGRVFASGLRNAVGVAVNPTTREIWVTQISRVVGLDRKSTRLNSSHVEISYAVF